MIFLRKIFLLFIIVNITFINYLNSKFTINASYWCAWGGNSFSDGGNVTKGIPISSIPDCYNVLIYAFAVSDFLADSATAKIIEPDYFQTSIEDPILAIKKFIKKGKKFLISVGGANGSFLIKNDSDAIKFTKSMIAIIDKYGFNGMDIDLESSATASDPIYFAKGIKNIVDYYRNQNYDFWLTFAMEWPYLRLNSFYTNLIKALGNGNIEDGINYTTYFWPQLYNQGATNGFQIHPWPAKWNEVNPQESGMPNFVINFIQGITNKTIAKYNNWICIPINKLAITLPASNGAANGGMLYVINKECIQYIYNNLSGFMGFNNWSIDFDAFSQTGIPDISYNCYDSLMFKDISHTPWDFGNAIYIN